MVSFGYASDGTRTSKTANGVTTTYYYVGGRLYGEMTGSNKLVYLYDDTGTPYGYVYNNATYYYERNAQGDVVSVFNQSGVRIANYTYDAWGNILTITDQNGNDVSNNATHQGNINPIRYRGYYYDAELNMYWLTTRFYDPEIGRFINADTQLNEGMLGNNLYAYCGNDPVNGHDPMGTCACNMMGFDCSNCRGAKTGLISEFFGLYPEGKSYNFENNSVSITREIFSITEGSELLSDIAKLGASTGVNYLISVAWIGVGANPIGAVALAVFTFSCSVVEILVSHNSLGAGEYEVYTVVETGETIRDVVVGRRNGYELTESRSFKWVKTTKYIFLRKIRNGEIVRELVAIIISCQDEYLQYKYAGLIN